MSSVLGSRVSGFARVAFLSLTVLLLLSVVFLRDVASPGTDGQTHRATLPPRHVLADPSTPRLPSSGRAERTTVVVSEGRETSQAPFPRPTHAVRSGHDNVSFRFFDRRDWCPVPPFSARSAVPMPPVEAYHEPPMATDEDACRGRFALTARPAPVRIIYCVMMSSELDILEVVLHEVFPVVGLVVVVESTATHSAGTKQPVFPNASLASSRFARFASKLHYAIYNPEKKFSKGWDVEMRQRRHIMQVLHALADTPRRVQPDDIVVVNMDLDELLPRRYLYRLRHCRVPEPVILPVVHFRYHFSCLQTVTVTRYQGLVLTYGDAVAKYGRKRNFIYDARREGTFRLAAFTNIVPGAPSQQHNPDVQGPRDVARSFATLPMDSIVLRVLRAEFAAWHLSAFGGIHATQEKYKNSPHRFLAEVPLLQVAKQLDGCLYNGKPLTKLSWDWWLEGLTPEKTVFVGPGAAEMERNAVGVPDWDFTALPRYVLEHPCAFRRRAWLL